MTQTAVRSGIIGTGFMGRMHLNAVRANGGEVAAVAGSSATRGEEARRAFGVSRASSPEELINSPDVDLVHICTPNQTHYELALAAIAAGKHVICEKPLAVTVEQARELAAAAATADVVNAVPFVYRYYPTVREAQERLRSSGERVWLLHGHYLQDWLSSRTDYNWRVAASASGESRAFADIGVHWCDLAEFMSGHRITRLSARMSRLHETRETEEGEVAVQTEDGVTLMFETDRGATGSLVVSQGTPGRKNRLWLSVDGERASYSFDQENPNELWVGGREQNAIVPKGYETTSFDSVSQYVSAPSGHPQGYQDCFNGLVSDVFAAIAGEDRPGMPTFADGARAAEITATVVRAAKGESWVDVPSAVSSGAAS